MGLSLFGSSGPGVAFLARATLPAGTLVTSQPMTLTQTWNAAGVTFTGFKVNITDTASAAGSLLADFQVGGVSQLSISKIGSIFTTTGNIDVAGTGWLGFNGRSYFRAPAAGQFTLLNNAETDFSRLNFGGTTSAFPALKRSSAELHARLADDSADANLQALAFKVATIKVVGAQGAAVADPTDAASTQARLTDLLGRLRTHGLIAT